MKVVKQKLRHLKYALRHRKAILFACILLFLFFFTHICTKVALVLGDVHHYFNPNLSIVCHSYQTLSLLDISDIDPVKENNIFFHETSCNSFINGKITIKARQACAVESAAKMNPNMDVYLMYASPGIIKNQNTESDRFLAAISSYKNVKIYHVDIARYLKDTPVEDLWRNRKLLRSWYAQTHISDVLRFLTLWKYGGIYLDLDVIVLKSLEKLPLNYAGLEYNTRVGSGVLSFDYTGNGHKYAQMCLDDLKNNFAVSDWGYNGPGTVTRLLQKLCGVYDFAKMVNKNCDGFKVYPSEEFYPVSYWNWTLNFQENFINEVFQWSKNSHVLHVWNSCSAHLKIPLDSNVPYLQYAKKYCPKVIGQCDNYF